MYDLVRINKMIEDISKFFKELEEAGLNADNLNQSIRLNASAMSIFSIMNRTVDIAQEILVKKELGMPDSYEESFAPLAKEGIINVDLAEKIEKLIAERKLFANHYFAATPKVVLKLSKDIYVVKDFIDRVKKIVEKEEKKK